MHEYHNLHTDRKRDAEQRVVAFRDLRKSIHPAVGLWPESVTEIIIAYLGRTFRAAV